MVKIFGKRGTGKTSELIKKSSEKSTPILVRSQRQKAHILENSQILGYNIPMPITFDEMIESKKDEEVLVEDMSSWAQMLFENLGVKMVGGTETLDDMYDEVTILG